MKEDSFYSFEAGTSFLFLDGGSRPAYSIRGRLLSPFKPQEAIGSCEFSLEAPVPLPDFCEEICAKLGTRIGDFPGFIASTTGPGSFTGLRAISSFTQAVQLSTGIPCFGFSRLVATCLEHQLPKQPAQRVLASQVANASECFQQEFSISGGFQCGKSEDMEHSCQWDELQIRALGEVALKPALVGSDSEIPFLAPRSILLGILLSFRLAESTLLSPEYGRPVNAKTIEERKRKGIDHSGISG